MEPLVFSGHALQVADTDGHRALLARRSFTPAEVVLRVRGNVVTTPSRYSLQVGLNEHVVPAEIPPESEFHDDFLWPFMNHSFDPSVKIVGLEVIAIREINLGDEICFNYNTTEWDMESPFDCLASGGLVRGYRFLSPVEREAIRKITAPHLIERDQTGLDLPDPS